MQVKCNPIWNVFNKGVWVRLIASVIFFCLFVWAAIYAGDYVSLIFVGVFLGGWNVALLFLYYPRSFELWEGTLRYCYSHSARMTFGSKNRKRIRAELTVRSIESVKLKQNALEKLFNTGRVTFTGYAEVVFLRDYSDFYTKQVSAPYHHTFYGIRDFDKFRNAIYDYIDPNILQIHVL